MEEIKSKSAITQVNRDFANRCPLRVLIVTPVGLEGRGGIDRLNSYFEAWRIETGKAIETEYLGSRGTGGSAVWPIHFFVALVKFAFAVLFRSFDIVHIHVSTDGSALRKVVFGKIASLSGMPYVIHYHGMMGDDMIHTNPFWLKALRSLARGAHRVILLGEFFRPYFVNSLGVDEKCICVIRNGVPDAGEGAVIPRPAKRAANILFAGEVGERKGVDILISALATLRNEHLDFNCTIAGNGDIDHWRNIALQNALDDKISFTGWVSTERVQAMAREADIIVLPSRAEALPLSLIEGASAGAALVATGVGAVHEIVHDGVNGMIVNRDGDDVASILSSLMRDREKLEAMQRASREIYLSRFTVPVYGEALVECLRQAARTRS